MNGTIPPLPMVNVTFNKGRKEGGNTKIMRKVREEEKTNRNEYERARRNGKKANREVNE